MKLTENQQITLNLIAQGYTNKMIAAKLFVTEQSVKNNIYNLSRKLDAVNRAHLVYLGMKLGFIR